MERNSTEQRLDDLNEKVDRGFEQVDRGFERLDADNRALRAETRTEFAVVRAEMKAGFDLVSERFEAMHRLVIQVGSVMTAALIGLIATQL